MPWAKPRVLSLVGWCLDSGARWRALSGAQKAVFESWAATSTRANWKHAETLSEARNSLRHQLAGVEESANRADMPCRAGECRFSQAETAAFNAVWDSDQFCGKQLKALVDAMLDALGSPSSIDQSALVTFSGAPQQQRHTVPSWTEFLVKHRSHFKPCVLRFRKGGTEYVFAFVFGASKSCLWRTRATRQRRVPERHRRHRLALR